jgi:phage terminase large subunit GpA-like protein
MLSPESSAEPGQWRTERVPYLREILDAACDRTTQDLTIVKCAQSAGSEVLLNAAGFFMDQEPSPILIIQPNVKPMGEAFSKDRIAPMIRDCERLRGKVKDPRSRDSGNTVFHKTFPGGQITIAGANSPAGLASRPIRVVLADEIDRWEKSAGTEGDPLSLAKKRQVTFRHRKKAVKVSSPGNEGESRIAGEWKLSDQRHFYVPCPHCGHKQPLEWRDTGGQPGIAPGTGIYRLVWEKEGEGDAVVHRPETAQYLCRDCGCLIAESYKAWMVSKGEWVKHNPSSSLAGWHIPGLLSPWVRWGEIAAEFLAKKDDEQQLKTFFNTTLGLLWVGIGDRVDPSKLASRREAYAAEVPAAVGALTAFIDVHGDRIEVDVRGWAAKEESYHIRLERLIGDPEFDDVWNRARAMLDREWQHESGVSIRIAVCLVDSGFKKDPVFRFVKSMPGGRVHASKGADNAKVPLSRASKANRDGVRVFTINPTTFKDVLFSRLKKTAPGPGYMHFGLEAQTGADDAYFLQYAAEQRLVEFVNNRPVVKYINPAQKRNEAIDHYVGNLAGLRSRGATFASRLGELAKELADEGKQLKAKAEAPPPDPEAPTPVEPNEPERTGLREHGRSGWWGRLR